MRILITTSVILSLAASVASGQAFSDDFESYVAGSYLQGQGGWWDWNTGAAGTGAIVETTHAFDGLNSVALQPASDTYNIQTLNSGNWAITTQVYIPSGGNGSHWIVYCEEVNDPAGIYTYGAQIGFHSGLGTVQLDAGGISAFNGVYVEDQWVEVRLELNLDTDTASMFLNGGHMGTFVWSAGYDGGGVGPGVLTMEAIDFWNPGTGTSVFYVDGVTISPIAPTGAPYCFGDSTGAACPCSGYGAPGQGCANTSGTGATLTASGSPSITFDTFQLDITGVPGDKPGLILRGANQLNGGLGNPVGDGLLCTSGNTARSHVQVTSAGNTTFTDFQGSPFGAWSYGAGIPVNYQFWYRDPANTCSGGGFNFTNAWSATWEL